MICVCSVFALVLEYAEHGSLRDILTYVPQVLQNNKDISRMYLSQLIDGLEYCHNLGIVHRDLKPGNLLLNTSFDLQIADFGLCKVFDQNGVSNMSERVGTLGFVAPEVLSDSINSYGKKCDIFSVGVILFRMLTGNKSPFRAAKATDDHYSKIIQGNFEQFWDMHSSYCENIDKDGKDLITRMLLPNPNQRISIADIKEHAWFKTKSGNEKENEKDKIETPTQLMQKAYKQMKNTQHRNQNSNREVMPEDRAKLSNLRGLLERSTEFRESIYKRQKVKKNEIQGRHHKKHNTIDRDKWRQDVFTIKDPLIVMLGIGKYDGEPDLIGVPIDYRNMKYVFNFKFGYSMFYRCDDNTNKYCENKCDFENECEDNFKTEWSNKEIESFVNDARKQLVENRHDSLIFIICAHGGDDGVIEDSTSETYQLDNIYSIFDSQNCPTMKNNPKLFFVDICRGKMRELTKKRKSNADALAKDTDKRGYNLILGTNDNHLDSNNNSTTKGKDHGSKNIGNGSRSSGATNDNDNDNKTNLNKAHINRANFRVIYANIDGYISAASTEGGSLIRAIKSEFLDQDKTLNENLDEIVKRIRWKAQKITGKFMAQNVQDVINTTLEIRFEWKLETFVMVNNYDNNESDSNIYMGGMEIDENINHEYKFDESKSFEPDDFHAKIGKTNSQRRIKGHRKQNSLVLSRHNR